MSFSVAMIVSPPMAIGDAKTWPSSLSDWMRLGIPLTAGIVADTPARLMVPSQQASRRRRTAAPEDAGAVADDACRRSRCGR